MRGTLLNPDRLLVFVLVFPEYRDLCIVELVTVITEQLLEAEANAIIAIIQHIQFACDTL